MAKIDDRFPLPEVLYDERPTVNQKFKSPEDRWLNYQRKDLLLEALRLHHGKPRFDFPPEIIGRIRC